MRFRYGPVNHLAVSAAVFLSAWTVSPLLADAGFLAGVLLVVGVSGGVGAVAALARAPRPLTFLLQLAAMVAILWWRAAGVFRGLPDAPSGLWERVRVIVATGTGEVRNGSIPLEVTPSLLWLVLALVALVTVATELLVDGLEQPAWSISALFVPFGIGAIALPLDLGWPALVALAAGYGGILLATTGDAGRAGGGPAGLGHLASRAAVAAPLVAAAVALSLLVAPLVPLGPKLPWLQQDPDAPIQLADPTIALNENLRRPTAQPALRYSTSDGSPLYLRTVALTRLTSSGAQLEPMQLRTGDPRPDAGAHAVEITARVRMQLPSDYLPAPFAPDSFRADGRWAYDPRTLAIVATGRNRTEQTVGLEYEVTSLVPRPGLEDVRRAGAGRDPAGGETLSVPSGLDPAVLDLAATITANAGTAGEKALAIQAFLRSDEFTYSMQAPGTAGMDAISSFLLDDRAGYCIHFAAAMVTLARLEGIPARMAVGFTPGTPDGDGFVVTTHNMHTWPELHLDGLGWVPFEPTKSIATPPGWTDPDQSGNPEPSPTPSASPSPGSTPTTQQPPSPTPEPTTPAAPPPGSRPPTGLPGWWLLAVALLLVALPLLARTAMGRWRLRQGQPPDALAEAAWREVRATFLDARREWDEHSPTLAVATLRTGLPAAPAALLGSVATTVERALYARGDADLRDLPHRVRSLRRALLRTLPPGRRATVLLLPASLLPGHWRRWIRSLLRMGRGN